MSKIKNSKILITGGAGFIGSNLADEVINDNEVVVVDDLSMGKIENLPKSKHMHFYQKSITDYLFMFNLLTEWKFDYIFLLAAVASVPDTIQRPKETHEINQNANLEILEIIRSNKLDVKKILFPSSAAVYGNNPQLPKTENAVIDPLSPYAIDKFATERFVINYGRLYGLKTVVTRFFNVYGPKQNPESPYSGVLSLIADATSTGNKFCVFGDGMQTRDFVYVGDVIRALLLLVTSEGSDSEVFNVATGHESTLNDVISIFEKITNRKINKEYYAGRVGDIKKSVADISKIQAIGFEPQWNLEDGLQAYWDSI